MEKFFKRVSGFTPYPYQIKAAELIFSGKNILLTAPTGAGKTWTALLPFLYAKWNGKPLADRCIFSLPLRTLATTLFKETVQKCESAFGRDTVIISGKDRNYQIHNQLCITIPLDFVTSLL